MARRRRNLIAFENRLCGGCSACCTQLPIPAGLVSPGSKPAGVQCPHLSASGCRIYSRRPQMCADFHCVWLADATWPDPWRPDRSGLLCLKAPLTGSVPAALVYEITRGALQSPLGREIVAVLERSAAIIVLVDSHRRRWQVGGSWVPHAGEAVARGPHFRSAAAQGELAETGAAPRREAS